jgi:hypothetical protein
MRTGKGSDVGISRMVLSSHLSAQALQVWVSEHIGAASEDAVFDIVQDGDVHNVGVRSSQEIVRHV